MNVEKATTATALAELQEKKRNEEIERKKERRRK